LNSSSTFDKNEGEEALLVNSKAALESCKYVLNTSDKNENEGGHTKQTSITEIVDHPEIMEYEDQEATE